MSKLPAAAPAPARGLVLIGIALAVGAFFLSVGFDDGGSDSAALDLGPDSEEDTTDTTAPPVTTGTETPATVPVYVANGSGGDLQGLAVTQQLQTAGYAAALPPGDAPETAATQVFYLAEWDTEAQAVAAALALGADRVVAWPNPAPFPAVPPEATVIVQVGADLAG